MAMKGAGYSIEALLASAILFTFAFGAVQMPDAKDWSSFQRGISARDLSLTLKKTGDLNSFLENSDTGNIREAATAITGRDLKVSGTVHNLPMNQLSVGFHTTEDEIHTNMTVPIGPDDRCFGDLGELESESERPVRRSTNISGSLEKEIGTRLYFTDEDPTTAEGFNDRKDYDSVYVDNGSKCLFSPSEGPYRLDEILYWGNRTDGRFIEFKNHSIRNNFTVYDARRAARVGKALRAPVNGIETDTAVDTFTLDKTLSNYDITVFMEQKSLEDVEENIEKVERFMQEGSVLVSANLSRPDMGNELIETIGLKWLEASRDSTEDIRESFSSTSESERLRTLFNGVKGDVSGLSLVPGGKIYSSQSRYETSREDLLYTAKSSYRDGDLNGAVPPGEVWTPTDANCGTDTSATMEIPDTSGNEEDFPVVNRNLDEEGGCGLRGLEIDRDRDGSLEGPFLENEVFTIDDRRYVPKISSYDQARLVFAGSRKVELVNYRKSLEEIEGGGKAARTGFEEVRSEQDIRFMAALLYWLAEDQNSFNGETSGSTVSTQVIGGIDNGVFMPYKLDLRWSE